MFSIILYSYKLYYCQIYLPHLWHFATLVLCTWLHPINMLPTKHIPFCQIIPPVYLQCQPCLWIGECFYWNPCLGLQWWPHWDPFPKSKYFKLSKPDQNDKTGPEILLTAHATSLTKEPCLAFVAVEQPSIFKPCQKFTASPFPYSMMFKQETCVLKNIYWSSHIGNSVGEAKIQKIYIGCIVHKTLQL